MQGGPAAPAAPASTNHPILAMLARLAGGVGSAMASPADITIAGTAIPAGIAGASESLAEYLEGSDQDPKRIGMESAIGAIPFGKLVKEGSLLAKMLKAGAIGGTSEAGREVARGEDINIPSIGGQAALGAGTFGLLHSLMGLRGAKAAAGPTETTPPVITREGDTKIFRVPPSKNPTAAPAPSPQAVHYFRENIRDPLQKSMNAIVPSGEDMVGSLDQGKQDALKIATKNRLSNVATERSLTNQESAADLQQLRKDLADAAKAAKESTAAATATRLRQEALDKGFVPGDPSYGTSESGKTPGGVTVSKRQPLIDPNAGGDDAGGGGSQVTAPRNPLDILMDKLGMNPTRVSQPELPISQHPDAPWGGARLPIEPPKVGPSGWVEPPATAVESQAVATDPVGPPAPASQGSRDPTPVGDAHIPPQDAPGATTGPAPESALLRWFKTPQGATGANYGAAKAGVKTGDAATAALARDQHLIQLGRPPEGPLADPSFRFGLSGDVPPISGDVPPIQGGMTEPPPQAMTGNPDAGASLAADALDWIKEQSSAVDRMKRESGQINPALLKFLGGASGAVVGAPVGAYMDPDDPNAAVKGAVAGGVLGYAGSQGANELINWRNAGLLATPAAQGKKPLSDISAVMAQAAEDMLSGNKQRGANTVRELLRVPTNAQTLWQGLKHPELAEDVLGDAAKPMLDRSRGALGWVARPFAGMQHMSSQIMQRAGATPEEARRTLMLGSPMEERVKGDLLDRAGAYDAAQKLLDLQKYPVVRALRPFARIGTNIAIRGAQRIPGLSMVTGDPSTRVARTALGAGAMGLGALVGASDTQAQDAGEEPTSPLLRGLRRAALASYGLPFTLGESLAGPRGIRDLIYMTPGTTETIPPPAPQDTLTSYGKKFGKRWLDQLIPDWANPEATSSEAQR